MTLTAAEKETGQTSWLYGERAVGVPERKAAGQRRDPTIKVFKGLLHSIASLHNLSAGH